MELLRLILVSFGVVYSAVALLAGGGLVIIGWIDRRVGGDLLGLLGLVLLYIGMLGLSRLPALLPAF